MPRFVIDLGDIDMDKNAIEELNADLQKTALSYVARFDFDKPIAVRFPRPFPWGIILRPDFDDVLRAERVFKDAFEQVR